MHFYFNPGDIAYVMDHCIIQISFPGGDFGETGGLFEEPPAPEVTMPDADGQETEQNAQGKDLTTGCMYFKRILLYL